MTGDLSFLVIFGYRFTKTFSRSSKNWCKDQIWKYTHHLSVQCKFVLLPFGFGRITVSLALFVCQRCLKKILQSQDSTRFSWHSRFPCRPFSPGFPTLFEGSWCSGGLQPKYAATTSENLGSRIMDFDFKISYISYAAARTGRYRIVYNLYMCQYCVYIYISYIYTLRYVFPKYWMFLSFFQVS